MGPRRSFSSLALVLLALAAGCGAPTIGPETEPAGYTALQETFGPKDFGPLGGRRIILDPGHGGHFRGAVGPNGLAEADVNLGVALHLRGLLEWAGAEVHLTRTADYDFLAGTDSTLAADLAFRVDVTDSIQPDVFLSLHHNATAKRDPSVNETQTYHPLGADGAALDLARSIHRHLARNLEIRPARLLPGNFHVLRRASVPAVLGEPAMISHPVMAGRLSLAASHRLEAEAYFLGLLDYFAGGDPGWSPAQAETLVVGPGGRELAWVFLNERRAEVGGSATPGPDPQTFRLEVDGIPVPFALDAPGRTVRWTAPHVPNRSREVTLRGRNLAGRAAPVRRAILAPSTGTDLRVRTSADQPGASLIRWSTPDGAPLPTGHLVWPGGGSAPVGQDLVPEHLLPTAELEGVPSFQPAPDSFIPVAVDAVTDTLATGWSWRAVTGPPPHGPWRPRLLGPTDALPPEAGRIAIPVPDTGPTWWEAPGRTALALTDHDPGFPVTTRVLAPGLEGRTVVIDPAGGGTDADGTGPLGLRGADVNLGTARQLAQLLEGFGARAVLTRQGAQGSRPTAKVGRAQQLAADLFLTIGRHTANDSVGVGHHPSSAAGRPWAEATAVALGNALGSIGGAVAHPSWAYLLRHTSCPAIEVRLPHAATLDDEQRLASPAWQAFEARAILAGIMTATGDTSLRTVDTERVIAALLRREATEISGYAVWDGHLPWYGLDDGGAASADSVPSWRDPGMPLGDHEHILEWHEGGAWQVWRVGPSPAGFRHQPLWAADRPED